MSFDAPAQWEVYVRADVAASPFEGEFPNREAALRLEAQEVDTSREWSAVFARTAPGDDLSSSGESAVDKCANTTALDVEEGQGDGAGRG